MIAKNPGVPMPVAVLRIPNPKFPLKFKMGADEAMVPGTPFKGPFAITARFSATGDAMDKSGPEAVVSTPVKVGTSNLKLELFPK